jgi:hypothetical protein
VDALLQLQIIPGYDYITYSYDAVKFLECRRFLLIGRRVAALSTFFALRPIIPQGATPASQFFARQCRIRI